MAYCIWPLPSVWLFMHNAAAGRVRAHFLSKVAESVGVFLPVSGRETLLIDTCGA